MAIYLDGMFYRCSGVGRVYENLLEAFSARPEIGEIHTVVPASQRDRFLDRFRMPSVRPIFVDYGPMSGGDLFLKSFVLRPLRNSVRLFFFPGHNVPLTVPGRYIVSVNDITVFSGHFDLPRYRKAGFRWLLSRAVRGAGEVVTISATVKRDLVREFGLPPGKVRVIYPWIRDAFFLPPPEGGAPVPGDYILYLGLRIAHKNVEGVLRAFALIANEFPALKLVIAGSRYSMPDMVDRARSDPRLSGRIVEMTDPSDDEIRRLLGAAKGFVFPSFAEGFGLPPLEAMAAGVPVVCSDIPVFREVYGDAACFVEPSLPESIAAGLRRILGDSAYAGLLSDRGRRRAARYRAGRSIEDYLDLVREDP
ncbi:MAG: glycosyltransferase family 1 protein [Thermodesulfobacteriota bacterium]